MNKETRIKKIQEIVERDKKDPFGKIEIPWQDELETMEVYKIPLDLLVYNKYNGRILSRTKSLEKQNQQLDVESDAGKLAIEKLLWDSKPDRNKKTQKNISDYGQQKVGIITKDGIIIDGNRRAMLLNKILKDSSFTKKYNYFKAVVLPVTLDENPLEIEKLETSFQMGEDEKLGYNATEKYIKAKGIYLRLTKLPEINPAKFDENAVNEIADWMGETNGEVKKYLNTMVIMDQYLEYVEYEGIYTQLDDREDQFLFLTKWLNNFYGEESKRAFDGYTNLDVDDLRDIAFDYIRIRNHYDGKLFRDLGDGYSDKHFFGNREVWKSFSSKHFNIVSDLPEEPKVDFDSTNLEAHLNSRDNQFFESANDAKGENQFIDNLKEHQQLVGYNKAADEPEKLVKRASQTFDAIKTNHSAFQKPEVQKLVEELSNKIFATLQKKSPSKILSHIINLLESIDVDKIPDSEIEAVQTKCKKVQQIGYQINKQL